MRVLVTHADSHFAQALLPALCEHRGVESVTGIAPRAPGFEHPRFRAVELDSRAIHDLAAHSMLAGHDALLHLAQHASPRENASETLDASVRPVHKLFHAAHHAGVRRLIHLSSAAVYGPVVHASEQTPLEPLSGFRYAQELAHLEKLLAIDLPSCVRLRPALIVGPHADPAVRRFLRQPFYPRPGEPQPLFQCVHEDDLASAVLLCLDSQARGAYNIASEESFTLRDAICRRHRLGMALSPAGAQRGLRLANRFLKWRIDPAWLERASHTVLLNCRRAIIELGWRWRYSAHEALATT